MSQNVINSNNSNFTGSLSEQFRKLTLILWLVSGVVFILSLIAILIKVFQSTEIATLRYNIIVGVSEIGSRYELLKLPAAGLLIGVVNFVLSKYNRSNQQVISLVASLVTLIVNLILLFAGILLFQVN